MPRPAHLGQILHLHVCLSLFFALVFCGCDGGTPRTKLAPVKGIVLYDGKPVEGAIVEFHQENSATRSMGFTNEAGQFVLTSNSPGDGAPIGVNKVSVSKRTKANHPAADAQVVPLESIRDPNERRLASMKNTVADKIAADAGTKSSEQSRRDLLPPKFAKPESSGLSFEVKAGVPNEFQIVLTD